MTASIIERKIRRARIAAMISGIITLASAVTLLRRGMTGQISYLHIMSFVDAILIFSMAFGIHRKSRVCSVLLFEYFLFSRILSFSLSGQFNAFSFLIGLAFLFFMFGGIQGTFAHHKCVACRDGVVTASPLKWIMAGSGGLVLYVLVVPLLLISG